MDTQPDKNKQKEEKERIKALENELKIAFKGGQFESVIAGVKSIKAIDPKNHLAEALQKKMESIKKQEELKAKEMKMKEYKLMLKKLLKDHDAAKLKELAAEFAKFVPEDRMATAWLRKAEKLEAKLAPKGKEETKKPVEVKKEMKPSVFAKFFKKDEVQPALTTAVLKKEPEVKLVAPKEVQKEVPKETPKAVNPEIKPVSPNLFPSISIPGLNAPVPKQPEKPVVQPPAVEKKPVLMTGVFKKPEADLSKTAPAGNIFTKMFGKKEEEEPKNKSIIDTIVASGDHKEKQVVPQTMTTLLKQEKPKDAASFVTFSKIFMNFAIIFVALSAAFLYVEWVDKSNSILSLVGVSANTGSKLYGSAEEVTTLTKKEADLNKEIELYKGGYDDKTFKTVQSLISSRINWPDIFAKIKEVTNSVYELNDFFKYIEYNNYAFDAENSTIRVTGTLSDPLGRNMTKLVELEQAFENFPRDINNPDDKAKPYFTGFKEFTTFSKTLDESTGRYNTSFQLAFSLNK